MTHKGTRSIQTQRLLLRRFTVQDAEDMFRNWADDERVTRFLSFRPHGTIEVTRELLENWSAAYKKDSTYNWAIVFDGAVIGSISVVECNERSERASLGYCIGYDYWSKGIMTEAAKAVIDYLFSEVGVHRVEISHADRNPGSGKVAQKCGLRYEGTRRDYFKSSAGEFLDVSIYGITRDDWEKQKA